MSNKFKKDLRTKAIAGAALTAEEAKLEVLVQEAETEMEEAEEAKED